MLKHLMAVLLVSLSSVEDSFRARSGMVRGLNMVECLEDGVHGCVI
jgi:hypothetical protein